ncbi:MAG: aminotransferase class V-fold PLP-dependent enzyme [Saprospiraceae bacterium]|nr:aminotransferase class V-fold PLP-dependent enzyme [Saprospiraceae bacterium]MCF8248894.1 aminotransferase class V-fold PLP-dependent enzyme [Saprospiraceae bacterium]MCF8279619.1 aminotransferase class V-fold PLP-dependent enzyme [Bacteroidales bacterium]MCF8310179.1 aminotransferase class V-fold PLP-dependent enzyme [Saprospiraceae bacterium]MCF8439079.1 aminotransferase class V-fold PLP-dependent enzyme [Saprospiraceae bacterium]
MNIQALRDDTPGCALHTHLNNAGASLPPIPVSKAVQDYLTEESLHGGYEMAAKHAKDIAGFSDATARLINAQPHNIAFAGSATDAFFRALSSIPFEPGDVILTTDDDYVSNQIAFLYLQKKRKIRLLRAAKLPEGGVDPQSVKELIDLHQPKLVAVAHVPTNSGLVQDIESVGQFCQERDVWYIVDACQSAGQMPLDVAKIGCDFLCATMRKWLRGPRGAGFLYVSDLALGAGFEPVFPDMAGGTWVGPDEYEREKTARRYEQWEKNYGLVLGSKVAIEYAMNLGLEAVEREVTALSDYTRSQLSTLPGIRVLDWGLRKCGIVTANIEGKKPTEIKKALDDANIHAGIATPINAQIDFHEKGVDWALRISPHYYNTKAEIDKATQVLSGIL